MRAPGVLRLLLRLGGAVMLLAFVAAVEPWSLMEATHGRLGLGTLPATPIVEYLARSISLLYGFHGVILLVLASDLERFRPLVRVVGWMNMVLGAGLFAIDLDAGLPAWWTWSEGPSVLALGVVILVLSGER